MIGARSWRRAMLRGFLDNKGSSAGDELGI